MEILVNVLSSNLFEIIKSVVKEIKAVTGLSGNCQQLREKVSTVESVAEQINNVLKSQGRPPLPVVRDWLEKADQVLKSANDGVVQYEERKQKRCLVCCPNCWHFYTTSKMIRKSLKGIDKLLEIHNSTFPKDGELGEIPPALLQPVCSDLVGTFIHEKLSEVESWLLEDEAVRTIGVFGMPGAGKTTFLKKINNNENVIMFFKFVMWVTISKDPDIPAIQRRMCERLGGTLTQESSVDEGAAKLCTLSRGRKMLLILDDMWSSIDVAQLGVSASDDPNVKILFSTRTKSVCEMMNAHKTVAMKQLSEEDGWELFRRAAFGGVQAEVRTEIEGHARNISRECKGNPLAIRTVAHAMPKQQDEPSTWRFVLTKMKEVDPDFYQIHEELVRDLFQPLKYSFDALQTNHLKIAFLYLAAFKEGDEIDAEELMNIWLAEGLVQDRESGLHNLLEPLDDRCLAEIVIKEENGVQIRKVKIHDILRDMAIYVSKKDGKSLFWAGQSLKSFPHTEASEVERVSLMHNEIRSLPKRFDCNKLLALFLSWNHTLGVVPQHFLENLSLLKVLDLSNTSIKSLPPSIGQLKQLVYLRLSNTHIQELPFQAYFLDRLQLLDLSFSNLMILPSSIEKLQGLKILNLAHCKHLAYVSSDISQLTGLVELDMWNIPFAFSSPQQEEEAEMQEDEAENQEGEAEEEEEGEKQEEEEEKQEEEAENTRAAFLQDIRSLTQLKKLRMSIQTALVEGVMGSLTEMREVWLHWMPEANQVDLPADMRAMEQLERLQLHDSHITNTSDYFSMFETLVFLKLKSCQLLQTLSGFGLSTLLNLKEIEIEECNELKELGEEFGKQDNFPGLRKLTLKILPSLTTLCGDSVEEEALPMLETVGIFRCENLKRLPSGLDSLKSLREIKGNPEWWNEITWEGETQKNRLQMKYVEAYHRN